MDENGEQIAILEEEFDPNYQPTQEGNHTLFFINNFQNRDFRVRVVPRDAPNQRPKVFLHRARGLGISASSELETMSNSRLEDLLD